MGITSAKDQKARFRFVPMKLQSEWIQFSPSRTSSGGWMETIPFHCLHSFAKRSGGLIRGVRLLQ
jgi:hypothetical protein